MLLLQASAVCCAAAASCADILPMFSPARLAFFVSFSVSTSSASFSFSLLRRAGEAENVGQVEARRGCPWEAAMPQTCMRSAGLNVSASDVMRTKMLISTAAAGGTRFLLDFFLREIGASEQR